MALEKKHQELAQPSWLVSTMLNKCPKKNKTKQKKKQELIPGSRSP